MPENIARNTAHIDGQGNITVQGNLGDVTLNLNDPNLERKLEAQGENIEMVKQLIIMEMAGNGQLKIDLEKLMKRFPKAEDIPFLLRSGSLAFFQQLTSAGGRFEKLQFKEEEEEGTIKLLGLEEQLLTKAKLTAKKERSPLSNDQQSGFASQPQGYGLPPNEQSTALASPNQSTAEFVKEFWKEDNPQNVQTLLLGASGMGKTINMILLWKTYLEQADGAIPIFISLHEYNSIPPAARADFLIQSILKQYLGERRKNSELEKALWDWLRLPVPAAPLGNFMSFNFSDPPTRNTPPKLLLLLDGWNEITVDKTDILKDLQANWMKDFPEIQLVVSSREDLQASVSAFADFKVLQLLALTEQNIRAYLIKSGSTKPMPVDPSIINLIANPMMLSLYVDSLPIVTSDRRFTFKAQETSGGELIWNFIESKLHKRFTENPGDYQLNAYYHFLNKHILSFIGFEMQNRQLHDISEPELEVLINDAFIFFDQEEYFTHFRHLRLHVQTYRKSLRQLNLGKLSWQEKIERFETVLDKLRDELFPFARENGRFHFLHQSFRDFYAAFYVYDALCMALEKGETPSILKEQPLAPGLLKMLGELEGEQYNHAQLNPHDGQWVNSNFQETKLTRILDYCRGVFEAELLGSTVYNTLEIWKKVRKDLSGANLSNLDLCQTDFFGVVCGHSSTQSTLSVNWEGAHLAAHQFFPKGHCEEISATLFSPDGQYLISAAWENDMMLWSIQSRQWVRYFSGHQHWVVLLGFMPSGKEFLSLSIDKTIKLWSVDTGACLQTYPAPDLSCLDPSDKMIPTGFETSQFFFLKKLTVLTDKKGGRIFQVLTSDDEEEADFINIRLGQSISFSPDGKQLAYIQQKRLVLWSISEGKESKSIKLPQDDMNCLTYASDGSLLAVGGAADGSICLFSLPKGQLLHTFQKSRTAVLALDFCLKKQQLFSIAIDNKVKIWSLDPKKWEKEKALLLSFDHKKEDRTRGHLQSKFLATQKAYWTSLKTSPSGDYVAIGSSNQIVKILSTTSGLCLHYLQEHQPLQPIQALAFNPDSELLVSGSGDKDLRLWSVKTGENLATFKGLRNETTALARIAGQIAVATGDFTIKLWDLNTDGLGQNHAPAPMRCTNLLVGHENWISRIAYSPDQKWLASASYDHSLKLWSVANGMTLWSQTAHPGEIIALAFHPEGQLIATGSENIKFWEAQTGQLISEIKAPHGPGLRSLIFTPEGVLISGGRNNEICWWKLDETNKWIKIHSKTGLFSEIMEMALSPSGQYLACLAPGQPLHLWDLTTENEPSRLKQESVIKDAFGLAISPDNRWLAHGFHHSGGGHVIQVYELAGDGHFELEWHDGIISSLVFSADSEYLISGAMDSSVKLWDFKQEKVIQTIPNIHLGVLGSDFSKVQWITEPTAKEKELLVLYGAKNVWNKGVDKVEKLPQLQASVSKEDRFVVPFEDAILIINDQGAIRKQAISSKIAKIQHIPGNTIDHIEQVRFVVPLQHQLLAINKKGEVTAYDIGDSVGVGHQLSGAKVAAVNRGDFVTVLANRLFVIKKAGDIVAHTIGDKIKRAWRIFRPNKQTKEIQSVVAFKGQLLLIHSEGSISTFDITDRQAKPNPIPATDFAFSKEDRFIVPLEDELLVIDEAGAIRSHFVSI